VKDISPDGAMRLKLDSGREMNLNPERYPHIDHGYAVTSYSGQGQTADRVLVHVDTNLAARDLLNNRMAYVSVSRGQWDAQIFTNDRGALAEALGHDVSHRSAYQPAQAIAPPVQEIAETHTPKHDFSQGIGMGLGM
jgi:ATP-dependent exoDNAse (exonuclease V) alpha subunit